MTHCWESTETVPTVLLFIFQGEIISAENNISMIVSEDFLMKLRLITTSTTFCVATIVIYAHNEQFSGSFAPGHSLY